MKKISFVATKNIVKAEGWVIGQLYKYNAELVEELGGEMVQGNEVFTAKFKTATKAKEFVSQAKTYIPKKTYNANRKTEPKKQSVPEKKTVSKGKGKSTSKFVTVTDSNGNTYKVEKTALKTVSETKKAPSGKGNSNKPMTERQKKHKAYLKTNEFFGEKRVDSEKWHKKYEQILAKL